MYRLIEELNSKGESERKVYGVLTDYDLSSWRKDLENDYTRTSHQRTGTPPYMAFELLQGTSTTHLYRHDLESLFYIMLLMAARHTIAPTKGGLGVEPKDHVVMRGRAPPYQKWFETQDYDTLGSIKESFFSSKRKQAIELSPTFEAFRPWLKPLRYVFSKGFEYKGSHPSNVDDAPPWMLNSVGGPVPTPVPVPLDDETLGGCVNYLAIIEPTRHLENELEGLTIRYEPTSPPLPTQTGAAQANARLGLD